MSLARGDVVAVDFPMGQPAKRRPALVIQSDHNNTRLVSSIFAMITSNTRLAGVEGTQVLIELTTPAGQQGGLRRPSAVKCENLYTLPTASARKIGSLPAVTMQQVDLALKASLALP